jgi:hypothetical protein
VRSSGQQPDGSPLARWAACPRQRWIDSDTVTLVSCVTTDLLTITAAAFLLLWLGGLAPAYLTAAVAAFAAALVLRHSGEGGVLLEFWPQLLTAPRIVVPVIGVGTAILMLVRMYRTDESRRVRGWLHVVVLVTALFAAALTVALDLFLIGYGRMLRGP